MPASFSCAEAERLYKLIVVLKVKVTQSCPTLCNPMDYIVHRILEARILDWVAVPFSRDLPNTGIERKPPTLHADSLPAEPPGKPSNDIVMLN